jgi:hypothetical protein
LFKTIPTHTFLLFPRRILSTQILYKLKMSLTSQSFFILMFVKCVICVLYVTHYKCWHSYLTRSSVCNCVYNSLFVTMAVLCILLYKVSVPRLYPITLMYDLETVWFQRLMYLMYTLDMFYILNFAIALWIYETLNKMKWNKIK